MNVELLQDLARHQAWADEQHWTVLRANPAAFEDSQIRKRLNHMAAAQEMLTSLVRGETPDASSAEERESIEQLAAAMAKASDGLRAALGSAEPDKMIKLPRGPKGPFEAPAWVLLLQALTHSQHHRGQNSARMRDLGMTPPMTDFVIWYALGRP
jgi:uncharacterized damage-inducible protein DinB